MGRCLDCKNFVFGKININGPDIKSHCGIGNDVEFKQWWDENGTKKSGDLITDAPCYEPTKPVEMLDNMLKTTGEILALLKKENTCKS